MFYKHFVKTLIFVLFIPINQICAIENEQENIKNLIEQKKFIEVEIILRKQLKTHNKNPDDRFQLARVLSWQKKYTEALQEYAILLKLYPQNTDYQLGNAQTLYWSNNHKAALNILEPARIASPNNQEIWKLQISILQASLEKEDKVKAEELRIKASNLFPLATWHKKEIKKTKETTLTEVETGISVDSLDGTYDDWSSYYLSAEHKFKNDVKIYSVITQTERFKLIDNEYLIGIFTPISSKWNITFDSSFTPNNKVRPKNSTYLQLQHVFNYGWNGYLGFRKSKYNETDTQAINITLERYWDRFRFGYGLFESQVRGSAISTESLNTHTFSSDYFYGNSNYFGIAITSGKELEYNGRTNPPISNIESVVIRGRHWLNSQWAINYSTQKHIQGNFYTRYGYRLGLRYRY